MLRTYQYGISHLLYVIVVIAHESKECFALSANISMGTDKKLEKLEKLISLERQKLYKENEYLQNKINMLHQKTNIIFEYCKLQPDDICGS